MNEIPPRRLHTVAVFSGAYGGLALLVTGLILISSNEWIDRIRSATVLLVLSFLGTAICIGMNRRRRWAWWLGVGIYGALTLAGVAFTLLGLSILIFGVNRHGGASGDLFYMFWFSGSIALLSGVPLWNLIWGRSELRPR